MLAPTDLLAVGFGAAILVLAFLGRGGPPWAS